MSDGSEQTIRRVAAAMQRAALWPSLAAGAIAAGVGWWLVGGPGAVGAGLGALLAIGSGAVSLGVMRGTAAAPPITVMSAALFSFVTKFAVLLLVLLLFRNTTLFDVPAFALSLMATTLVWTTGEGLAFMRAKIPSVSPESSVTPDGAEATDEGPHTP